MPDFDFDAFNHDTPLRGQEEGQVRPENGFERPASVATTEDSNSATDQEKPVDVQPTEEKEEKIDTVTPDTDHEEVDKW